MIYFLRQIDPPPDAMIKIGTSVYPRMRLQAYLDWSPVLLEILTQVPGGRYEEWQLHYQFRTYRAHREWFRPSEALLELIEEIKSVGHLPFRVVPYPPGPQPRECLIGLTLILARHGISREAFATAARISPATVNSWIKNGYIGVAHRASDALASLGVCATTSELTANASEAA